MALIRKDFYTKRWIYFVLIIAWCPLLWGMYFVLMRDIAFTVPFFSLGIGMIAYLMATFRGYNPGTEEKESFRLLLSLPVDRKTLVRSTYVMFLIWWLIALISYSVLALITILVFPDIDGVNRLLNPQMIPMSLCFSLFMLSFYYPARLQFGYRAASTFTVFLFIFIWMALSLGESLPVADSAIFVMGWVLGVLSLAAVVISYLSAVYLITHRDY